MSNIRLKDLIPKPYYQDVYEMDLLAEIEQYSLDEIQNKLNVAQRNFFIMTADSNGIAIFEEMYGVTDSSNLDLEARRYNVLARSLPPKPITMKSFQEMLDLLNINAKLVVNGFDVTVVSSTTDSQMMKRLNSLMKIYLPANLKFKAFNVGETSTEGVTKHGAGHLMAAGVTSKSNEYAK